jgi:2-polyprenyl-3-methyl-5-hydroxy-6-metoxy-1,4-benzoquinol methylase
MQAELMDASGIDYQCFKETLAGIESLNQITGAYQLTIKAVKDFYLLHHANQTRPLKVLDIGSGNGDHLRALIDWALKDKISLDLTGVDLCPHSKMAAYDSLNAKYDLSHLKKKGVSVQFITDDIFKHRITGSYDICLSSLMTHHLTNDLIIDLLIWMTVNTKYGWFVHDLHRHPLAYYFIKNFTQFLAKPLKYNHLVQHDAALSVARAFKKVEWLDLCKKAQLDPLSYHLSWQPMFKYCICYQHKNKIVSSTL